MRAHVGGTEFDSDQYSRSYADGMELFFWNVARNRIIERHLRKFLSQRNRSDSIVLDIGCGRGIVVDHLRNAGINCLGVEPGQPQVLVSVRDFVRIGTSALEPDPQIAAGVGAILLLDVLEHIERPDAFLRAVVGKYPSVDYVMATVPARMELWSHYDEYYGHFLRYDKPAMRDLAEGCGLQLEALKYFFIGLYPVIRMQNMMGRRTLQPRPPKGLLSRAIHALVGIGFCLEERLPSVGLLPGSSLLAIMRVPRQ